MYFSEELLHFVTEFKHKLHCISKIKFFWVLKGIDKENNMRVDYVNNNNMYAVKSNPAFGTKLGHNLTKYLYENRMYLSPTQLKNIRNIKGNGLKDTTLELEKDANGVQVLVLTGDLFTEKNNIMNNPGFRKWAKIRDMRSYFPIKESSDLSNFVLENFNYDYLNGNIRIERDFAKRVIRLFKEYQLKHPTVE